MTSKKVPPSNQIRIVYRGGGAIEQDVHLTEIVEHFLVFAKTL